MEYGTGECPAYFLRHYAGPDRSPPPEDGPEVQQSPVPTESPSVTYVLKECCRNPPGDFHRTENFPYLKPPGLSDLSSPYFLRPAYLLSFQANQGQDKKEIWVAVSWIFGLLQ